MKLSNFALSIVASLMLGISVSAAFHVVPKQSTAVISIPAAEGVKGGGMNTVLPRNVTVKQAQLLSLAYEIAKQDGHKHPQLLQGIILQESQAGEHASYRVAGQEFGLAPNKRYYGIAQIKLAAARDVLDRYPSISKQFDLPENAADEEVIAKLIENDEFNLSIASKYLLILRSYGYDTIKQLALAYNQGPGGARNHDAETHHYTRGVMHYIQSLPPLEKLQRKSRS